MSSTPFPVLGILGGGQLGRMTALAVIRMGIGIRTLSPEPASPVAALGDAFVGDWTDPDVLREFACRDYAEPVRLNAYVTFDGERAYSLGQGE